MKLLRRLPFLWLPQMPRKAPTRPGMVQEHQQMQLRFHQQRLYFLLHSQTESHL